MAVITISFEELKKFVNITKKQAIEKLPLLGVPTEIDKENEDKLILEITPDRPDLLSVEGIGRLLNSYFYKKNKEYNAEKLNEEYRLSIDENVKEVRPYIAMAVIKGIKIDENVLIDLMQLQEKLHNTIGRKRKKVAVGIHDLDNISFPLKYSAYDIKKSPKFIPLEKNKEMNAEEILKHHEKGISYAQLVSNKCVVITDSKEKVLSFPPIINSELTKLTTNTKNVLIDVTGTQIEAVTDVLNIIVCNLIDRKGKLYEIKIGNKIYPNLEMKKMKNPQKQAEKILGKKITKKEIKDGLEKMGFKVKGNSVYIPPYRTDILGEIDLIEDIAISMDYNSFIPELPNFFSIGNKKPEHEANSVLTGLGFNEVFTWTLSNEEKIQKTKLDYPKIIKIENPLTRDFTIIRPSILPNLLEVFAESKKEKMPQSIYEIGVVANPELKNVLAGAMTNSKIGFTEIKSVIQALIKIMDGKYEIKPSEDKIFITGRSAGIWKNGKKIGMFGEVYPEVLLDFGLECPVVAFEIEI
ncbi:MAG: phenylalanine--tRNA ligase subunit beta [Candidatus Micrarchaeia archaeon]|jgi:phenylalanyl-tRNA synthetase beta chain